MRIGIDARTLSSLPFAGISYTLFNLLKQMERLDTANEFYLYSTADFKLPFENPRWKKRIGSGHSTAIGIVWMCTQGRRMVLDDELDVFWSPWPLLPFNLSIRKAVTVHDFAWRYFPQTMHPSQWFLYNLMADKSIAEADAVFAVSHSTLKDIGRVKNRGQGVYLTYNGVDPVFQPLNQQESAQYISKKYNSSSPYILNVGTVEPRKNIINLLQAFKELKTRHQIPHQLLIAGAKGWKESPIYRKYQDLQLEGSVLFLGHVPDEDLPKLYSGAHLFIYPSLYEGFGLPVLEAMACGCPVVTSNTSSLPEVVGDCGLLVDPHDPKDIAIKIYDLISDPDLRNKFSQTGVERSKLFSWNIAAQKILKVLVEL